MSHDHEPITLGIMQYTWFSWKVVLYIFSTSELSEKVVIKMLYKEKTTIILNFDQSCILCFDYKPFYHEPRSLNLSHDHSRSFQGIKNMSQIHEQNWTEREWTAFSFIFFHLCLPIPNHCLLLKNLLVAMVWLQPPALFSTGLPQPASIAMSKF